MTVVVFYYVVWGCLLYDSRISGRYSLGGYFEWGDFMLFVAGFFMYFLNCFLMSSYYFYENNYVIILLKMFLCRIVLLLGSWFYLRCVFVDLCFRSLSLFKIWFSGARLLFFWGQVVSGRGEEFIIRFFMDIIVVDEDKLFSLVMYVV